MEYVHYPPAHVESESDRARRFFYNRSQEHTEGADVFLQELKRLASEARFNFELSPEALEKLLKDRFIEGLRNQQIQDFVTMQIRMEKEENPRVIPLQKVLDIVKSLEAGQGIQGLGQVLDQSQVLDQEIEEGEIVFLSDHHGLETDQTPIKNESDDFSKSKYSQQYPCSSELDRMESQFAAMNSKLRSTRVELTCQFCEFKCLTKVLMASHSMTFHGQESAESSWTHVRCQYCEAVFLSRIGLEMHQVLLHNSRKESVFRRLLSQEDVVENSDGEEGSDEDYIEDLMTDDLFEDEDKSSRSFSCEICKYRTTTAAQLRKHMAFFHQDAETKHQCRECLYRAVTEEALTRHITQNHQKPLPQKVKCELCNFITAKKTELTKHIQTAHRGHKVYMCETCGKKFQTDKTLEVHHKVVHLNQKPFSCKMCDYKAGQKASLIAHMHSIHEGSKPYVCETCGYKTTSQSTLNAHKRMVHEKQRPHVCEHCGRSFAARAGMENHIQLIHEKQTPFTCDRCGKKFKRRPDLNNHIRCIHENNYYICNVCNNSFQTARNLERHVSTVHEQSKPFECTSCGQAFARRERLKHHVERNHPGMTTTGIANNPPGSVLESHHSNMESPHVPASPHMVPSPQNVALSSISHEQLLHGQISQEDLDHRMPLMQNHHSQPHPMILLVHQSNHQLHN